MTMMKPAGDIQSTKNRSKKHMLDPLATGDLYFISVSIERKKVCRHKGIEEVSIVQPINDALAHSR